MKTKYKIMWCHQTLHNHGCTNKRQMERFVRLYGEGLMRVVLK